MTKYRMSWKYFLLLITLVALGFRANAQTATPDNADLEAGDTRIDDKGIEQVYVPAGCFMMGTSEEQAAELEPPSWARRELQSEQPQHAVCLSEGYWIDQYEVTNAAFQAFVDDDGYTTEEFWSKDGWNWLSRKSVDDLPIDDCVEEIVAEHPRVCITWYEAEAYANWRDGRLPSDAEWEFAARGPDSLVYPWGNEWDETKANVVDSTGLTPVGSYPDGVSWVGAHDMSGNAMEWVQDWLDYKYYELQVRDDPTGPEIGGQKIEKGGWWGSNPFVARAAYHHFEDPPSYQDHHIGVRVMTPLETIEE